VPATKTLKVGDPAPDFSLPAADGHVVRLSEFRGRSEVVLFFYPKDDSPVCTAEACSFRDSYDDLRQSGAEVIGVSADSSQSHRRFTERHRLPFLLLSDPDGTLRALYQVPKTFGLIPGRSTYVIDKDGVIRTIFSSQFFPAKHAREAIAALRAIREGR
jgi:thioredoxin-dependent peroxiredoxin